MANIKKTFNFRNGVQVDDDNLIVNQTGLVGIGTTIPTEALDVRGTAKIVGLVTATTGNIGVLTVTTVDIKGQQTISGGLVGSGVSIKSGVITATDPTGIVTFYGDARYLQGMPTSQWLDKDVGLGYSSIYNAGGNVGIHTNDPRYGLQIGGNNDIDNFAEGVGINSTGSIFATGIITATSFVGAIAGPVTGNVTGNINSSGVSTIATLKATNVNISGLSTHRVAFTNASDNLTDSEDLTFNDTTNTLNVVGTTDTDQLNVSGVSTLGVSTFTGNVSFGSSALFGDNDRIIFGDDSNLHLYYDGSASIIKAGGQINLATASDQVIIGNSAGAAGVVYKKDDFVEIRDNNTKRFRTNGIGVTVYNQLDTTNIVASGVITATTELNSPLVGVGTDDPQTDIQVRKTNAAQIRVSSDTDAAVVSVGREPGAGNGNNAAIRFGNNSAGSPYSDTNSFDLINYDSGNFNFYLGVSNAPYGDFYWHKQANSARLMTLTNEGRLGIGVTLPTEVLHVGGGITCTGNVYLGNNLTVGNNLTLTGSGNLTLTSGTVTGGGGIKGDIIAADNSVVFDNGLNSSTALNKANSHVVTGVSTFVDVVTAGTVKIKTNHIYGTLAVNNTQDNDNGEALNVQTAFTIDSAGRVGIGTNQPECTADFSGRNAYTGVGNTFRHYMRVPIHNNTTLTQVQGDASHKGAIIFNVQTNKLCVWNGSAWEAVH
jgi:hypothetical protein